MTVNTVSAGVIILNYNNPTDTIACIESVLASTIIPQWIFVVDNASTDDSIGRLSAWADTAKIPFLLNPKTPPQNSQIVFIESTQNNGYAAGNNLGIQLAMQWGVDAVWILNNDTEVEKEALGAMFTRLFSKSRPGLCGSLVCYKDSGLVQCCAGGKTNSWTGLSVLFGQKLLREEALKYPPELVEESINFIYGASVMASRDFINTVGFMDERYFLYCEEQDWAYSAKGRFDFAYAPDAIVHHKEGGTTGFNGKSSSLKSLWLLTRSRLLLTQKHKPWALPTVFLSIFFAGCRMLYRRISLPFSK